MLIKKNKSKLSALTFNEIGRGLQGLFDYYTAPNIKHKIKHSLFLALRFPECITLFYNPINFSFEKKV